MQSRVIKGSSGSHSGSKSKSSSNSSTAPIVSLNKKKHFEKEAELNAISSFIDLAKGTELKREEETCKKKERKEKRKRNDESEQSEANEYPYTVNDDDHCETPTEAYSDIAAFLNRVAASVGKTNETLQIFDPYHCEGSVIARLGSIGFKTVHNEKEDFYATILNNEIPEYDVLVTNPPYSSDHMKKLLKFCAENKKPWFLLLPNYVYLKDYYVPSLLGDKPFYVAPKKRYMYTTPKGRRQQKSAKYTAPFPTFWYCNLQKLQEVALVSALTAAGREKDKAAQTIVVCRDTSFLPLDILPEEDPRKKRQKNAKKRDKHKLRKKAKGPAPK